MRIIARNSGGKVIIVDSIDSFKQSFELNFAYVGINSTGTTKIIIEGKISNDLLIEGAKTGILDLTDTSCKARIENSCIIDYKDFAEEIAARIPYKLIDAFEDHGLVESPTGRLCVKISPEFGDDPINVCVEEE